MSVEIACGEAAERILPELVDRSRRVRYGRVGGRWVRMAECSSDMLAVDGRGMLRFGRPGNVVTSALTIGVELGVCDIVKYCVC